VCVCVDKAKKNLDEFPHWRNVSTQQNQSNANCKRTLLKMLCGILINVFHLNANFGTEFSSEPNPNRTAP